MDMQTAELADGLLSVALTGRLDTQGVTEIETRFTASIVPRGTRAVVDLSQVTFCGSLAIRMFISVARAVAKRNGKLVLFAPQPLVNQVFETVSLGELVPIQPDLPSATAAARA